MRSRVTNISRISTARFSGWRFSFERKGHSFSKYFSDRDYDTSEEGLLAAVAFRDEFFGFLSNNNTPEGIGRFVREHSKPKRKRALDTDIFDGMEDRVLSSISSLQNNTQQHD